VLQRITASPLSQKHNAAKRSMIASAASVFPWQGREIPSKPLLREHQRAVLLLCANDLRFRAKAAAKTGTNNHSPICLCWATSPLLVRGPARHPPCPLAPVSKAGPCSSFCPTRSVGHRSLAVLADGDFEEYVQALHAVRLLTRRHQCRVFCICS
jgi:hypothetical protein